MGFKIRAVVIDATILESARMASASNDFNPLTGKVEFHWDSDCGINCDSHRSSGGSGGGGCGGLIGAVLVVAALTGGISAWEGMSLRGRERAKKEAIAEAIANAPTVSWSELSSFPPNSLFDKLAHSRHLLSEEFSDVEVRSYNGVVFARVSIFVSLSPGAIKALEGGKTPSNEDYVLENDQGLQLVNRPIATLPKESYEALIKGEKIKCYLTAELHITSRYFPRYNGSDKIGDFPYLEWTPKGDVYPASE